MKTLEINLCEPTSAAAIVEEYFVEAWAYDDIHIVRSDERSKEADEWGRTLAKAVVTRQSLMYGDWSEVRRSIEEAVEDAAINAGLCYRDSFGDVWAD